MKDGDQLIGTKSQGKFSKKELLEQEGIVVIHQERGEETLEHSDESAGKRISQSELQNKPTTQAP